MFGGWLRFVVRQRVNNALRLSASRPVESRRERRDDFENVLRQLFFKRRLFALVDYHDFDSLKFAKRERQFSDESHQPVFVSENQPPDLPTENHLKQLLESGFLVVDSASQVP